MGIFDDFLTSGPDDSEFAPPPAASSDDGPFNEDDFQNWYKYWSSTTGISPDPDEPEHYYDYRSAYKEGVQPEISPEDNRYHWPSQFKDDDHPNRFVHGDDGWIDTKYGKPADPLEMFMYQKEEQPIKLQKPPETYDFAKGMVQGLSEVGKILYDIPVNTVGAFASLWEDDNPEKEYDWKDIARQAQQERNMQRMAEEGGETYVLPWLQAKSFREAGASAGFSGVAMGAGLVGGTVGAAAGPYGTAAGALGASGAAAYRMDKAEFTQNLINSARQAKPDITPDEVQQLVNETKSLRSRHALWEAIPEAVGNAVQLTGIGAMFKPILSKVLGKGAVTRAIRVLFAMYGAEIGTETITQMGQQNVEIEAGIGEGEKREFASVEDWYKSFKEVAPQTFILVSLTGGAGAVAAKTYGILSNPDNIQDSVVINPIISKFNNGEINLGEAVKEINNSLASDKAKEDANKLLQEVEAKAAAPVTEAAPIAEPTPEDKVAPVTAEEAEAVKPARIRTDEERLRESKAEVKRKRFEGEFKKTEEGLLEVEETTPEEFVKARDKSTRPGMLTPSTAEELKKEGAKLYKLKGLDAGYTIDESGYMSNLYNNTKQKGLGMELMLDGIQRGAKTGDSFDGFLREYYTKFGWKVTGTVPFDPKQAPPTWDYEKHGKPDVVFYEWPKGQSRKPEDVRKRFERESRKKDVEGRPIRVKAETTEQLRKEWKENVEAADAVEKLVEKHDLDKIDAPDEMTQFEKDKLEDDIFKAWEQKSKNKSYTPKEMQEAYDAIEEEEFKKWAAWANKPVKYSLTEKPSAEDVVATLNKDIPGHGVTYGGMQLDWNDKPQFHLFTTKRESITKGTTFTAPTLNIAEVKAALQRKIREFKTAKVDMKKITVQIAAVDKVGKPVMKKGKPVMVEETAEAAYKELSEKLEAYKNIERCLRFK